MDVVRSFRQWRRYRHTMNELNRLSQRELADLGMSRSDIAWVARRSVD